MVEAVGVGTFTQLTGGVVGYVPRLGDQSQRSVSQSKPVCHNIMSADHESVSAIPQVKETEVVIMLEGYTERAQHPCGGD